MRPTLPAFLFTLAACSAPGPRIDAHDGWARTTGGTVAAAYLTIENQGSADTLTGVRSPIGQASLHESTTDGGIARMRPIPAGEGLVVPSNGKLRLAPGGAHVMIAALKRPLAPGDRFSLTLEFAKSADRKVTVTVRPAGKP